MTKRWLPRSSAIVLTLYGHQEGLLTPDLVAQLGDAPITSTSKSDHDKVNLVVNALVSEGLLHKEPSTFRSKIIRNSPNRLTLTPSGKDVAESIKEFVLSTTSLEGEV